MRISDWSSDVCSSDLLGHWVIDDAGTQQSDGGSLPDYIRFRAEGEALAIVNSMIVAGEVDYLTNFDAILTGYATDAVLGPLYSTFQQNHDLDALIDALADIVENNGEFVSKTTDYRSEENTSELQSLMRISYAVFSL